MTIQQLLGYVVERKGSDLHLIVGMPPLVRVDGILSPVVGEVDLTENMLDLLMKGIMSPEQKESWMVNKDIDFSFSFGDRGRFRVNAYFQKGTMAASLRLIEMKVPTIDELGLPKICHTFTTLKQGFVLVTGPTGQGKSTTLAAILNEINQTRPIHLVTIEDPIEYLYTPAKAIVSQREIHNDAHSWDVALRSVLREDPDVVLIGEMRDYETIAAALTIAETGHLVFATLHTNSAAQTIDRIVDVFPENQQPQVRLQLSANLEAVFSQRLVPKIGGGRVVAYEVMTGTNGVKTAIREGRTHMLDNIIMTSAEHGMSTLEKSLSKLVRTNVISMETGMDYSLRPDDFEQLVKAGGVVV